MRAEGRGHVGVAVGRPYLGPSEPCHVPTVGTSPGAVRAERPVIPELRTHPADPVGASPGPASGERRGQEERSARHLAIPAGTVDDTEQLEDTRPRNGSMKNQPVFGPVLPGTMKAWVLARYGSPDDLELRDVPFPPFRDDHEVLVRVSAASVNPTDRFLLKPPIILRRGRGLVRPKSGRMGSDLAGRIEVVGRDVKDLHVGDEVFGIGRGSFGQYAIADETQVVRRPSRLTIEQAAAAPIAGVTAFQGLCDKAELRAGQRVLINSASGGVGTFAVQIAQALGAEVTAVCSPPNMEMVRSLGIARVVDYTREDFTQSGECYDVIFDTQLNHSLRAYRRVLSPKGVLVVIGAGSGNFLGIIGRLIKVTLGTRIMGPRSKFFIASVKTGSLTALGRFLEAGTVTPVIDRRYPFAQVPDAVKYLLEGHARGKIVVTM
jgi:NADPH:quinone reductase-like Zn-dependent oxidoreductase